MLNQRFLISQNYYISDLSTGDYKPTGAVLFILQSHGLKPGILVVVINH